MTPQNIIVYKSSEVFADAHRSRMDFEDSRNIFGCRQLGGSYTWGGNDKTLVAVDTIKNYIETDDLSLGDMERLGSLPPGSYIDLEN